MQEPGKRRRADNMAVRVSRIAVSKAKMPVEVDTWRYQEPGKRRRADNMAVRVSMFIYPYSCARRENVVDRACVWTD